MVRNEIFNKWNNVCTQKNVFLAFYRQFFFLIVLLLIVYFSLFWMIQTSYGEHVKAIVARHRLIFLVFRFFRFVFNVLQLIFVFPHDMMFQLLLQVSIEAQIHICLFNNIILLVFILLQINRSLDFLNAWFRVFNCQDRFVQI